MPDSEHADPSHREWGATDFAIHNDLTSAEIGLLDHFHDWLRPQQASDQEPAKPFVCEYGAFRTLHFDGMHLQSEMDMSDPAKLTIDYTRMMMGFLYFNSAPKRIEMIGLGGGSLAKYCYLTLPDTDITVIEINADVIDLRHHFLIPDDDDRFRVIQDDGAAFVHSNPARPDILLVDGFDAFGQPPQLCSAEFYAACYRRLAPGGMMVVNLWGSYHDKSRSMQRINDAFAGHVLDVTTEGGTNRAIFAGRNATPRLSKADVGRAMATLEPRHGAFLGTIGRRIVRRIERLNAARANEHARESRQIAHRQRTISIKDAAGTGS